MLVNFKSAEAGNSKVSEVTSHEAGLGQEEKESVWTLDTRIGNMGGLLRCCLLLQGENICGQSSVRVPAACHCEGQQNYLFSIC